MMITGIAYNTWAQYMSDEGKLLHYGTTNVPEYYYNQQAGTHTGLQNNAMGYLLGVGWGMQNTPSPRQQRAQALRQLLATQGHSPNVLERWLAGRPGAAARLGRAP